MSDHTLTIGHLVSWQNSLRTSQEYWQRSKDEYQAEIDELQARIDDADAEIGRIYAAIQTLEES